jgi:hypothetical protein
VENQARLWEEQFAGRMTSALSGFGTRIAAAYKLAMPNWRAGRAERLAEEAQNDVAYYKKRVQNLRLTEATRKAELEELKILAQDPGQNVLSRTWNKANLKMALWGQRWRKADRASLESSLDAASKRLERKLHAASDFEQQRRTIAERFTSRLARRMEPLTQKMEKLEKRSEYLNQQVRQASERRNLFDRKRGEILERMRTLDLTTPEGEREFEKNSASLERIAANIGRIDGTIRRANESILKCGTHHRRVARSHRFFSNASNRIVNTITHRGASQTEMPGPTATQQMPERRGFLSFMRNVRAAPRAQETPRTTEAVSETAFDEDAELSAIAEGIQKTPNEFLKEWNREYPEAHIVNIRTLFARAGLEALPPAFLETPMSLTAFLEKINELYTASTEFQDLISTASESRGFDDANELFRDFIIISY